MIVNFTKMHGLGNDFVVIDLITQGTRLNKSHIKRIADRKFGIGCDQVILITPPNKPDIDFFYRIYNADGQEVEQCGNGLRCAAKFFIDNSLTNQNLVTAACLGGVTRVQVHDEQQLVTANLGKNYTAVTTHTLNYPTMPTQIHAISTGNPHGVCLVDDIKSILLQEWGQKLTSDPIFPNSANIGFMQIVSKNHAILRVYERGVGPTLACGSAACAATLVGKHLNLLDNRVTVEFAHGSLLIELNADQSVSMTGPASSIYIGRFRI